MLDTIPYMHMYREQNLASASFSSFQHFDFRTATMASTKWLLCDCLSRSYKRHRKWAVHFNVSVVRFVLALYLEKISRKPWFCHTMFHVYSILCVGVCCQLPSANFLVISSSSFSVVVASSFEGKPSVSSTETITLWPSACALSVTVDTEDQKLPHPPQPQVLAGGGASFDAPAAMSLSAGGFSMCIWCSSALGSSSVAAGCSDAFLAAGRFITSLLSAEGFAASLKRSVRPADNPETVGS